MATHSSILELPVLDNKNDDGVTSGVSFIPPSSCREPIVTRQELWSYYCKRRKVFHRFSVILMGPSSVYINGGAVGLLYFLLNQRRLLKSTI
jgi:hypothetical protein